MNCLICDRLMIQSTSWRTLFCRDIGAVVCPRCEQEFKKITGVVCPLCTTPSNGLCRDCKMWERTEYNGLITKGKSLYTYNEAMQRYLHQYKFLKDAALAAVFAAELQEVLNGQVIVPIPMHETQMRERTFPHVEKMLDAARLPYQQCLLKNNSIQGKKTKQERLGSPVLFKWNGEPVPKQLTIVDDLYTTGTTIRHAAKVLRESGAEDISFVTLIRG